MVQVVSFCPLQNFFLWHCASPQVSEAHRGRHVNVSFVRAPAPASPFIHAHAHPPFLQLLLLAHCDQSQTSGVQGGGAAKHVSSLCSSRILPSCMAIVFDIECMVASKQPSPSPSEVQGGPHTLPEPSTPSSLIRPQCWGRRWRDKGIKYASWYRCRSDSFLWDVWWWYGRW